MYLVKIEDEAAVTYPIPEQNVRDCEPMFHGQMITPALAAQYGYGIYEAGKKPSPVKYQRVQEEEITQREDLIWEQQYSLREATDEEKADEDAWKAASIREERDYKLRWDVDSLNPIRWASLTTEQQDAMTAYRQELLDVPAQEGFPWEVTWPVKPEL